MMSASLRVLNAALGTGSDLVYLGDSSAGPSTTQAQMCSSCLVRVMTGGNGAAATSSVCGHCSRALEVCLIP